MFRLDSPNLPTTIGGQFSAPIARLYKSSEALQLASVAKINTYADLITNPDFNPVKTDLPLPPIAVFFYYRQILPIPFLSMAIPGVNSLTDSRNFSTSAAQWINNTAFNLYAINPLDFITGFATFQLNAPPPSSSKTFSLLVPIDFTCTSISSNSIAQIAPFSQNEQIVVFNNDLIKAGEPLQVSGNLKITLTEAKCKVAVLDFSSSKITYLDRLDFLGISFTASQNLLAPQINEFVWNDANSQAILFIESSRAQNLIQAEAPILDYYSSIAVL